MAISFFSEETKYKHKNKSLTKEWLKNVAKEENKKVGEINYIFCSDEYLLKINQEYLKHDTYTDIITFDYCENNILNSDIYISIDRVKENSVKLSTNYFNEINRVIVHGFLHLIGYKDKKTDAKKLMREKEDYYLSKLDVPRETLLK